MDKPHEKEKKSTEQRQIFRPVSLERLSNPEQLDSLLVVVTPKIWVALLCVLGLALTAALWAFFGSIPIKIEGKGIVMNQKGSLFNIPSQMGGTVQQIYVKPGDEVNEGDQIALIFDAEEQLKLDRARQKVVNLTQNLQRLVDEVEVENKAQREAQERELAAKEFSIEQLDRRIKDLETEVERRKKLHEQGLVSHSVLIETEDRLSSARIEQELAKSAIATLKYNLAKGYRTEEVKAKEEELFKATEERDLLETRQPYYTVYSTASGNVLTLLASEGDVVETGTPLVWVEYRTMQNAPYIIYGYFPLEKGKRINVGSKVQINVSTVDPQEYGYLQGIVKEVSSYAVSKDSIARMIHNRELVEYLSQGSAAVQVLIDLEIDPETQTYRWTSGITPPIDISSGTVCTLQAIIHRLRPIYYLIPIDTFKTSDTP